MASVKIKPKKDADEDHGANQVDRTSVFSNIWDVNSPPPRSSKKVRKQIIEIGGTLSRD